MTRPDAVDAIGVHLFGPMAIVGMGGLIMGMFAVLSLQRGKLRRARLLTAIAVLATPLCWLTIAPGTLVSICMATASSVVLLAIHLVGRRTREAVALLVLLAFVAIPLAVLGCWPLVAYGLIISMPTGLLGVILARTLSASLTAQHS